MPTALTERLARAFEDRRRLFRRRAQVAGAEIEAHTNPVSGPCDTSLVTDVAHLGPSDTDRAVLIVAGTHGAEGVAGSAMLSDWLDSLPDQPLPAHIRVTCIHGINPYGLAWLRRVNEDNVDLNRNFIDHQDAPRNAAYDRIADAVAPRNWRGWRRIGAECRLLASAARLGVSGVKDAITGGQYAHADGLFYGGTAPTWSRRLVERLVGDLTAKTARLAVIDLHTGLGPYGYGELISAAPAGSPELARAQAWYGGEVRSTAVGDSASSRITGDMLDGIAAAAGDTQVTGVALEFGTRRLFSVLNALRADAWLHLSGAADANMDSPAAAAVKTRMLWAFAPDDPRWRAAASARAHWAIERAIAGVLHRS